METNDLKKWAVEQAIAAGSKPDAIVEVAASIHNFVTRANAKPVEGKKDVFERQWNHKNLTPVQKAVLKKMIEMHRAGDKINGTAVASNLKPAMTQSNASMHLRNLVKLKYVEREGNKFWPVYDTKGEPLPVEVIKCPPKAAKGFKPMTVPLAQLAGEAA